MTPPTPPLYYVMMMTLKEILAKKLAMGG